jgi:hypothetical protein
VIDSRTTFRLEVTTSDDESDSSTVPRLFRRAAEAIGTLGEVYVQDIMLQRLLSAEGQMLSVGVFYSRVKFPIRPHVVRLPFENAASDAPIKVEAEHRFIADESTRHRLARADDGSIFLNNSFFETDLSSVPKLLRRIADLVDLLGEVHVDDIVLDIEEYAEAQVPTITIFYSRPDRAEGQGRTAKEPECSAPPQVESELPPGRSPGIDADPDSQEQVFQQMILKDPKCRPGYISRPKLLRQTADAIDALGEVEVRNLVLHEELTECRWAPEFVSFVTVYYNNRTETDEGGVANNSAVSTATRRYTGDQIDPDMAKDRSNRSFRLHNPPTEPGYRSVPKLLRRTADAIDALRKVEINSVVLHTEITAAGRIPTVAVYYSRPTRADKKSRTEWKRLAQEMKRRAKKQKRKKKHSDRKQ